MHDMSTHPLLSILDISFSHQGEQPLLPGEGLATFDISDARVQGAILGRTSKHALSSSRQIHANGGTFFWGCCASLAFLPLKYAVEKKKLNKANYLLKHTPNGATPLRASRAACVPTTKIYPNQSYSFHKYRALVDGRSLPVTMTYVFPLSDRSVRWGKTDSKIITTPGDPGMSKEETTTSLF